MIAWFKQKSENTFIYPTLKIIQIKVVLKFYLGKQVFAIFFLNGNKIIFNKE